MLREHYPTDRRFEEVLGYIPDLSPELGKIDIYLEDEKLYRLIKKDLSKRRPKTSQTGRNSPLCEFDQQPFARVGLTAVNHHTRVL